ncbi:MAG: ABC transporter substrate-binding protein [Deltaproteobacteria bacterium]|nr:ABC transporter substrate-binding protein [Deltaproteobacteria bacterium]
MKRISSLAILSLLFLFARPSEAASDLKTVRMTIPRGALFVLSYFGARDAGIFRKHGIDIQVDARPFAGFMASLPSREVRVATWAGLNAVEQINEGKDMVVIGGGLTVMQDVFSLKGSPVKKITDVRGKKFGVYSTGAGSTRSLRALVMDGFGIDVTRDTQFIEVAGPALMALLDKGEVDVMHNISSLSIAAASEPEKYHLVFSPDAYWKEKTGVPLVWSAPTIAWRDWIEEDRDRAKRLVNALHESWEWMRQNSDKAIEKYGKLAAVNSAAEAQTIKKMLQAGGIFLTKWDQQVVDAQWKFLEVAKKAGILDKVPPKEKHALVLR